MKNCTDEELFASYVNGDENAITLLYNRYRPALIRYLRGRLVDKSACDDIVQLTFIRLVKHKDRFTAGKLFKPWVYTIADRLSRDQRKVSKRRVKRIRPFGDYSAVNTHGNGHLNDDQDVYLPGATVSAVTPADENMCKGEQERQALSLLRSLPKNLRNTIQFSVIQGLSSREASQIFGVSHSHVQTRIRSGLEILRKQMESGLHGEPSSPTEIQECSIRDLVDSLPENEYLALQRVIFSENGSDEDHLIFTNFICRLVGELVSSESAAA